MAIYCVTYTYDDREELRNEMRPSHRNYLQSLHDKGVVITSGPTVGTDPAGAILILEASNSTEALQALDGDPFWTREIISDRGLVEWTPVIGSLTIS